MFRMYRLWAHFCLCAVPYTKYTHRSRTPGKVCPASSSLHCTIRFSSAWGRREGWGSFTYCLEAASSWQVSHSLVTPANFAAEAQVVVLHSLTILFPSGTREEGCKFHFFLPQPERHIFLVQNHSQQHNTPVSFKEPLALYIKIYSR